MAKTTDVKGMHMEQERKYDILQNASGDFMIAIRARMDDTSAPRIMYDGGEHALLYRNDDNVVMLDYIHPDVREPLVDAGRILIIEVRDGAIIREYNAPVKKIKKVPLPPDFKKAV